MMRGIEILNRQGGKTMLAEQQNIVSCEEETFLCPFCYEEHLLNERMELDGQIVCMDCYQENTIHCSHCGDVISIDENAGTDHTPLCQRCFDYHYTTCESCDCLIS